MPLPPDVNLKAIGASTAVQVGAHGIRSLTQGKLVSASKVADFENGGYARVFGTTKIKSSGVNIPVLAKVFLLRQTDKRVLRSTWSDSSTGAFEFRDVDARQKYLVLAEDSAGNFRPVAASMLTAEVPT